MLNLVSFIASVRSLRSLAISLACASGAILVQRADAAPGQACPRNTSQTPSTPSSGTSTTNGSSTVTAGGSNGPNSYQVNSVGPNWSLPPRPPTTRPTVDIPQIDPSVVDIAKAEDATAHSELNKAQTAISEITKKFQDAFNSRSDMVEATEKVANAKSEYDAAAAPVLAALTSSADYQAARATADEAKKYVDAVKADASSTPEMRMNAAKEALAAKDALTRRRTVALASDSKASSAKTKYSNATQALAALHQQYDDSLKQDPDYVSAKSAFDDARAKVTAADQKLAEARTAYARAISARNAALAAQRKLDRDYAAQQARR